MDSVGRVGPIGRVAVVGVAALALLFAGCRDESGGTSGRGAAGGGAGGDTTATLAGGEGAGTGGSEAPDWRRALQARLGEAPGVVYCAAGDGKHVVAVIDGKDDRNVRQIPVGYPIQWLALKPDGSELWCTPLTWDPRSGVLDNPTAVVDPKGGGVLAKLDIRHPGTIAMSPDGAKAYVALVLDDAVAVYDTASRKETGRIKVGKHPFGLAMSPDGSRLYVTHTQAVIRKKEQLTYGSISIATPVLEAGSEYVAAIDTARQAVVGRVELGGLGTWVAVSPDGELLYATVSSVDAAGLTGGSGGSASSGGRWDGVAAIDATTLKLIKRMPFEKGSAPKGVAFTPDGSKAYAICGARDTATPIDVATHRMKAPIDLDLGG